MGVWKSPDLVRSLAILVGQERGAMLARLSGGPVGRRTAITGMAGQPAIVGGSAASRSSPSQGFWMRVKRPSFGVSAAKFAVFGFENWVAVVNCRNFEVWNIMKTASRENVL